MPRSRMAVGSEKRAVSGLTFAPVSLVGARLFCRLGTAYRHHRRMLKLSPVTINHDLKLLRKMFAWGIRERLLKMTPFKVESENVIRLDPESTREERLTSETVERKLFAAANSHPRGVLIAMLETRS